MNNAFVAILISTIAGLSTVIGGLVIFKDFKDRDGFISFSLSFSMSVMITVSVFDLIPNSVMTLINSYGLYSALIVSIIVFYLGYLLVCKLNVKLKVGEGKGRGKGSLYRVGILSMLALIIHNFPEGIATFMTSYNDISSGIGLAVAIMLHNIPEGISISVPIYYSTGLKSRGLMYAFLSGISEPIGAIMAYLILKRFITDNTISIILIFVAGIMITLAINEMLPEANKYKKTKHNIIGFVLGFIIMLISIVIF